MDWNLIIAVGASAVSVCTFAASFLVHRRARTKVDSLRDSAALTATVKFGGELTAVYKQLEKSKSVVITNPPFTTVLEPDGNGASLAIPEIGSNFDLIGFGNAMAVETEDKRAKTIGWSRPLAAA